MSEQDNYYKTIDMNVINENSEEAKEAEKKTRLKNDEIGRNLLFGPFLKKSKIPNAEELEAIIKEKCVEFENKQTDFKSTYKLTNELRDEYFIGKMMLEILDGSHDLACDKEQKNPLIDYCEIVIPNISAFSELEKYRSQIAIKNKMKEIIQGISDNLNIALGRQKYTDSKFITIDKKLSGLQKHLKAFEQLGIAIIETHRGGMPNSTENTGICKMLKSKLSTIFDLNASDQMPILDIGEIKDTIDECSLKNDKLDIVRRFGNPFPQSCSIFIRKSELLNKENLKDI